MARPADHIREERPVQRDDRSLGELFTDLMHETETLVRQEIQLARVEMTQKATEVGKDIGFLVAGGAVVYAGLLTLIAFVVLALGNAIPLWASALIVGVIVLAIGGGLVWMGINNLKNTNMAPTNTIQTLQEDAQWAKERTT
jgi:uncharacterized membrane protein YqjE